MLPPVYADKGLEEQLNDLLDDFDRIPEASFEKALQRELIVAHVLRHREGQPIFQRRAAFELTPDIAALREIYRSQFGPLPAEVEALLKKAEEGIGG